MKRSGRVIRLNSIVYTDDATWCRAGGRAGEMEMDVWVGREGGGGSAAV